MSKPKSRELLNQFLAGEGDAAADIFDRYVARLLSLARARIGAKLRRRVDPDDVVQSAYHSFFVHARNKEYQLTRSGDLWRLLASTTLNKLYGQIERQTAAKRTIHRDADEDSPLAHLSSREPSVVEIVAMGEQLRLVMDDLSPNERMVLMSTLQGESTEAIASSIGKSERTIRRLLNQAKQKFEAVLLDERVPSNTRSLARRSVLSEPLAPLRVSDYFLKELIGSGGMGKVYRAIDKRSGKTVAIKALHKSRQSDERAVASFVQESQILAKLRHPCIVGVEGLGRFPAGGYFIVMDFIDGTDLQSRLASGPLPLAEALTVLTQVASAVQHAHDHGIVHCDLKPGNVLLDDNKHVFVTDFGFAFIHTDSSSTKLNSIGGTAGYLAPEVLCGKSPPTPATDIFALGVLLWNVAIGGTPFDATSLGAASDSRGSLMSICRRCLADNPLARYATATEFMEALNGIRTVD